MEAVQERVNEVSIQDDLDIDGTQYLTFIMASEEYGVDILCVQEIRGWEPCTLLPNTPEYIKGVINLRGTVVPIVDLRQRFGLPAKEYGATTVVIVVKVEIRGKSRVMGLVVDAVADVHTVPQDKINAPPDIGDDTNISFIRGLADVSGKMIILLEADLLLDLEELPDIQRITEQIAAAK